jgi:hypothetical protein
VDKNLIQLSDPHLSLVNIDNQHSAVHVRSPRGDYIVSAHYKTSEFIEVLLSMLKAQNMKFVVNKAGLLGCFCYSLKQM